MAALTPQRQDFPRWYQEVVTRAELAENGPVRGTMVIRPWGYAIWELMQAEMDRRIKATGVRNASFPLLIPSSFLAREAQHIEGFAPELAVVTHAGGEELREPLVVRPTSETMVNHLFAKWIQSHRDLPVLVNQWANVVRWELRPRLFLRTTEFLWQEGHTAHAGYAEAQARTLEMLEVYRGFMEEVLAVAVAVGEKTAAQRFAGADRTFACEALMRDGKALQMGTSHNLGHNFANAFGISYLAADGARTPVATTSWGTSARMLGAVIMAHGDDRGLRLPPAIAPDQVVVLALGDGAVEATAAKLVQQLLDVGVRARLDDRQHLSFGRRSVDLELKGVPVRLEVGERELARNEVTLVRRDGAKKQPVALDAAPGVATGMLAEVQAALYRESVAFRSANTHDARDLEELHGALRAGGFVRAAWCGKPACEERIGNGSGASIRLLVDEEAPSDVCVVDGAPAQSTILIGRAY